MPVLTGGQVLDREGTTVMPDWGGALLEGGLYNVGDHGLIEEAEEPVMGMGPYKYSGVPPMATRTALPRRAPTSSTSSPATPTATPAPRRRRCGRQTRRVGAGAARTRCAGGGRGRAVGD
jgi:hypothetical protein